MKKCKPKQILKSGYTTRKGTKVAPTCIKDLGLPGKGPKLFPPLSRGKLTKYGYHTSDSPNKRHVALRKAIVAYGHTSVIRKLNAVCILMKNTYPVKSHILCADKRWVQAHYRKYLNYLKKKSA